MLFCFWRQYVKVGLESVMQSPPIAGSVASALAIIGTTAIPATEGQVAAYIAAVLCGVVVAALAAFVKYMTITAVQGQERIAKAVEANTSAMERGLSRVIAENQKGKNHILVALNRPELALEDPVEISLE